MNIKNTVAISLVVVSLVSTFGVMQVTAQQNKNTSYLNSEILDTLSVMNMSNVDYNTNESNDKKESNNNEINDKKELNNNETNKKELNKNEINDKIKQSVSEPTTEKRDVVYETSVTNSTTEYENTNHVTIESPKQVDTPKTTDVPKVVEPSKPIKNVEVASTTLLGVTPRIEYTDRPNGYSLGNVLYKYTPIANYYVAENGSAPADAILSLSVGQTVTIEGITYTVSKVIPNIPYGESHDVIFSNLNGRAALQTCELPGQYTVLRLVILS